MNQTPAMTDEREADLLNGFGNLIGRHADWLDVETFLRLAKHAAGAYFGRDELDEYFQRQAKLFAAGLERGLKSYRVAQNTSGIDSSGPMPGHESGGAIEGSP